MPARFSGVWTSPEYLRSDPRRDERRAAVAQDSTDLKLTFSIKRLLKATADRARKMVVPENVYSAAVNGELDVLREYFASGDRDPNDVRHHRVAEPAPPRRL